MKNYTEPGNLEPPVEDLEENTYTVRHSVTIYRSFEVKALTPEEAERQAAKQLTDYIDGNLTKPFNMVAATIFQDHRDMWEHESTELE